MRQSEPTFFDQLLSAIELPKRKNHLSELNEFVPWEIFRPTLDKALFRETQGPGGRPSFDRLLMFKILVLQSVYNLSDAETEFQIADRMSFRRFLAIGIADRVPDEKTIWLFRERLGPLALQELMVQFMSHLKQQGIQVSSGRIVDATFCEAPIQRNSPNENRQLKKGRTPKEWQGSSRRRLEQKDVDARWGRKHGRYHFGYKLHIAVDKKTKLITGHNVTGANVHDCSVFTELLDEKAKAVLADRGYDKKSLRQNLKDRNITAQIPWQIIRNGTEVVWRPNNKEKKLAKQWNRARCRVEHIFGAFHTTMRGFFFRRIGHHRAMQYNAAKAMTYNFLRGAFLMRKIRTI